MGDAPRSTRRPSSRDASAPDESVVDAGAAEDEGPRSGSNRRGADRLEVLWSVDCETEDTFLYAAIANISAMGIFVRTEEPLAIGTELSLRFAPPRCPESEPLVVRGRVQWVNPVRPGGDNPNPGMGIRFIELDLPTRERLVEAVRSIAYLREDVAVHS